MALMKCPVDDTVLAITERQGIEIDYCPTCRGVWLDRGELDKLLAKAEAGPHGRRDDDRNDEAPRHAAPEYREDRHEYRQERHEGHDYERRHYDDDDHYGKHHKKKRRESFLGDLFDF